MHGGAEVGTTTFAVASVIVMDTAVRLNKRIQAVVFVLFFVLLCPLYHDSRFVEPRSR